VDGAVPYTLLHDTTSYYDQLRVFGCLCYPNLSATASHKLAPRSTACIFLGYPSSHKGYRCLDLVTKRIIISRHVVFDETLFPFSTDPSSISDLDFLSAPNPAAARVAAPSLHDIERPRPSPTVHEDDDPAILVRGPLLQALPLAQVPTSPPPTPPPAPHAPLPADPRVIVHVYRRRPRPSTGTAGSCATGRLGAPCTAGGCAGHGATRRPCFAVFVHCFFFTTGFARPCSTTACAEPACDAHSVRRRCACPLCRDDGGGISRLADS
jgi:hypothetical protein